MKARYQVIEGGLPVGLLHEITHGWKSDPKGYRQNDDNEHQLDQGKAPVAVVHFHILVID